MIPLGARSVGHYRVAADYRENPMVKHFVQVFWSIAGTGALVINGREKLLRPGWIALYFPGMEHNVHGYKGTWEYRWWTMDGALAASITAGLGLTADIYKAGPAPLNAFKELENAIRDPSRSGEIQAAATAFKLLSLAASLVRKSTRHRDEVVTDAAAAIHRNWNHPDFCVKTLAAQLKIHRSQLSRRFKQSLGIAPTAYMARLRMQNALSMLKETGHSISEVAALCGYADHRYFARCLRRATGATPRKFRRGQT
jgi:AraC-like DNA-binding protein